MTAGIAPMAFDLETERLAMGMWEESDAAWCRQLAGEGGAGMPAHNRDAGQEHAERLIPGRACCADTGNEHAAYPHRRRGS
jgi:hypothetical protein